MKYDNETSKNTGSILGDASGGVDHVLRVNVSIQMYKLPERSYLQRSTAHRLYES